MCNFKKAFEVMQSAVGEQRISDYVKFRQAVLSDYPDQQSDVLANKSLQMMASILFSLDRYEAALDYFSWLSFYSKSDTERISWDMESVQSMISLEKYKSAESQLRQIEMTLRKALSVESVGSMIVLEKYKSAESMLRQIEMAIRKVLSVEISEPLHTHVIGLLERAGQEESRLNTALVLSDLVFEMYRLKTEARRGPNLYPQDLEVITRAEDILDVQADRVDIRRNMTVVYSIKAGIHQSMGDFEASENMYIKSITLCKSLYGSHAATAEIARLYSNLSSLYIYVGKYSQAEQLIQQALDIRRDIFGNYHHTTMSSMYQLGTVYYNQGKYLGAIKLCEKVIKIHQNSKAVLNPDDSIWEAAVIVGQVYNSQGDYTSAYNFLSAAHFLDSSLGLLVMSSYDTDQYTHYMPSVLRSLEKMMTPQNCHDKMFWMMRLGKVCMDRSKWSEALGYLSAALSLEAKARAFYYYQEMLLAVTKTWQSLGNLKAAVQFSVLVLRSEGETPNNHAGEGHYFIGDCCMRPGLYKKSWSHLHSALFLYQNLPKYRSFVLMLAKIHLSIAILLFRLCRVSESLEHAMNAVKCSAYLISDQEKTTRECFYINEQASMFQDTLVLIKA